MQRFGRPGATMVGSDSHTCAAGSLGMLAIGVGGLDVAMAIAGEPLYIRMPEIWGIRLTGELPPWVSAKDVILEMLRRHGVKGGSNRIIEYHGPGLSGLSAMDRHVIANMGAELGATTTVFPSDERVRAFLASEGRGDVFCELTADEGASYDVEDEIDLSSLEPLIAKPSSPGNVVPVAEVAGEPVRQVVVGSSANPGLRDAAVVAATVAGQAVNPDVSLDVNPTSREIIVDLTSMGLLAPLVQSGARLHQAGCLGCIGMGQAPASDRNSLRTFPRNFPGRSGTKDDAVWLCSPETAVAAALTGEITDPRTLTEKFGIEYPQLELPEQHSTDSRQLIPPPDDGSDVELVKGPNIASLPEFDALPERLEVPVLLKVEDDVSTDEIMPAGNRVLPFRSNIERMADFVFIDVDEEYSKRAKEHRDSGEQGGNSAIVAGQNYGQGSSREHAAVAPRSLGLRLVVAKSFARIHWQNLANFGVLALELVDEDDYDKIENGNVLVVENLPDVLKNGQDLEIRNETKDESYSVRHRLSERQIDLLAAGGLIPTLQQEKAAEKSPASG
jgi:aconitate hydratase